MANIRTFFSTVATFFGAVWASFICLFAFGRKADSKACDIEAGLPDSTKHEKELSTVRSVNQDVESGNGLRASSTNEFVDIDLNAINQAMKMSEKRIHSKFFEKQSNDARYDQPTRRPSSRMSAVDPVKSRILDTTLKNVQDRTMNVVKPVIITPGTLKVVACTAKVEYYHGPIIEPSSAKIEYFDNHTPSSAKVEYYQGPVIEPSSAQVEFFDGHIASTAKIEYYHGHISEGLSAKIEHYDAHVPSTAKVEYLEGPTLGDSIDQVVTAIPGSPAEAFGTLHDQSESSHETTAVDDLAHKPFLFSVKDVDAMDVSSPGIWPEHYKTMFKDNRREPEYEVSFTQLPEKKSRRVKEKRARQRESLFDIIAQFPDIPRHTPPGPKFSVARHEIIEEVPTRSSEDLQIPQSPASESSTSSAGAYYGSGSDDTAQTSVPSSPELVGALFGAQGGDNSTGAAPLWEADINPSGGKFSGNVHCQGAISTQGSISGSLSNSGTNPRIHSNQHSYDINEFQFPDVRKYPIRPEEESTADQFIIDTQQAAAYAILTAAEAYSDVSVESLLGQLQESSFDSTYIRPQSVVWFRDRSLRQAPVPEVTPSTSATQDASTTSSDTSGLTPASGPGESSQDSVAPLRIVKKSRIPAYEIFAEAVDTGDSPSESTKTEADSSPSVEQDEVLLQEYERWEESRQAGLKAFREAVVGDDDFYGLFYRDFGCASQPSLAIDIQHSLDDFSPASPSDSGDSDVVCPSDSHVADYLRSEESMEEFSSCYDDLSELTGVTTPENNTTGSLSVVFDCKELSQENANASSDSLSFYGDEDEQPPAWDPTSDSNIDRVASPSDGAESSFELEAL
ncbi:hypothetical protein JR316_0012438 [Psilocybe cubensis]|uniref:Uncharacterized protein n=2 Tax=Psilocybe cubensis TaxID=181762 RepID=A0ACB8GIX2_PSICU|nr:hypothetical protein JR316_0012438 [Psilocybe cubensis]KAH9475327.1 hypothetical protein JR316_0012438 [Psilocybe cubensis]